MNKEKVEDDANFLVVSESLFGYCLDLSLDKYSQIQKLLQIDKKISDLRQTNKIMVLFLVDYVPEFHTLFKKIESVKIELSKPPILKKLVRFCEIVFDWLSDDHANSLLIVGNSKILLVTMILHFSRFYESFSKNDIKLASAIKKYINSNITCLQKTSVAYRRYADYMGRYSYMNRLTSLNSSVQLYCINLSHFPNMEANSSNTTDIFFKIYTRDPLQCCHTTKTYPLPTSINRLVIMFEKYPISLYDDIMIVCYHKYPITGRKKLFRLNFHCCEATGDMLSFIASDFEELYPGCPLKMKIDLLFRASAIYGDDGNIQTYDDSSMSILSPIQKVDSYSDFPSTNIFLTSNNKPGSKSTNNSTSSTDSCQLTLEDLKKITDNQQESTIELKKEPIKQPKIELIKNLKNEPISNAKEPKFEPIKNEKKELANNMDKKPVNNVHKKPNKEPIKNIMKDPIKENKKEFTLDDELFNSAKEYSFRGNLKKSVTIDEPVSIKPGQNTKPNVRRHKSALVKTTLQTDVGDYRKDTTPKSLINQRGQITGPVGSSHKTTLDSVRTSTTALNDGSKEITNTTSETQKMADLMIDLNKNSNKSHSNYNHSETLKFGSLGNLNRPPQLNKTSTNSTNNTALVHHREVQLMNELLEAQKEITNLRQSMNQLDKRSDLELYENKRQNGHLNGSSVTQQFNSNTHTTRYNSGGRPQLNSTSSTQPRINLNNSIRSVPSSPATQVRSLNTSNMNGGTNQTTVHRPNTFNNTASSSYLHQYQSAVIPPSGYSAHRENMEKERTMRSKTMVSQPDRQMENQHKIESQDIMEEVETINLQPIGKGIHDLTGPNSVMPHQPHTNTMTNVNHSNTRYQTDNMSMRTMTMSPGAIPRNQNLHGSNLNFSSRNIASPLPNIVNTSGPVQPLSLQSIQDKIHLWYKPNINRDEATMLLKTCGVGSFLIRDSSSYMGAYGLAVKVANIPPNVTVKSNDLEAEKVRHYLIEPINSMGSIQFKGYPQEPSFHNLPQLVLHYTQVSTVLPCCLVLPTENIETTNGDANLVSSPVLIGSSARPMNDDLKSKSINSLNQTVSARSVMNKPATTVAGISIFYLGSYDVEHYTGASVINKSIEKLLEPSIQSHKGSQSFSTLSNDLHLIYDPRKFTECQLIINNDANNVGGTGNSGIILTDVERKLFFRRHHHFEHIIFCGLDPRGRKLDIDLCKSRGVKKPRLFGFITRESMASDSKCYLFADLESNHKSDWIVNYINQNITTASSMK